MIVTLIILNELLKKNVSSPKVVGFSIQAKIFDILDKKNATFLTPLKAFILALKDSKEAFLLSK
jgi:hypothetical protein